MDYFLIILGFFLIIINLRPLKKEKNSFNKILEKEKLTISELDTMREELLRDISVTLNEMKAEIYDLKGQGRPKIISRNFDIENFENNQSHAIVNEIKRPAMQELFIGKNNQAAVILDIKAKDIENKNIEVSHDKESNINGKPKNGNLKVDTIRELINLGLTTEEISEKTKISKGEILLIKELYLK